MNGRQGLFKLDCSCAGFPFWDLGTWEHKETFTGVLTAGRVAKVAFDKAGIPAHVLYHNHANYVSPPGALPFPPLPQTYLWYRRRRV